MTSDEPSYDEPAQEPELEKLVVHVAYEVAAMRRAAQLVDERETGYWIFLEAFFLHARVLREFFCDRWEALPSSKSKGVYAEDYFPSRTDWREVKGQLPSEYSSRVAAISAQVAHLSRRRVQKPEDLEARLSNVLTELESSWETFLAKLESQGVSNRADQFRRAYAEACERLGVGDSL